LKNTLGLSVTKNHNESERDSINIRTDLNKKKVVRAPDGLRENYASNSVNQQSSKLSMLIARRKSRQEIEPN
jgi:hypothetical protein